MLLLQYLGGWSVSWLDSRCAGKNHEAKGHTFTLAPQGVWYMEQSQKVRTLPVRSGSKEGFTQKLDMPRASRSKFQTCWPPQCRA